MENLLKTGIGEKRRIDLLKKYVYLIFCVYCLLPIGLMAQDKLPVRLSSKYAVLINADNGCTIVEKNHLKRIYPASTTKIVTALFALHQLRDSHLDIQVECPKECLQKVTREYKLKNLNVLPPYILQTDGTTFHLVAGEKISYKSLLYGLLVSSGNDAANVLAYHLGKGSIEQFMHELNQYVKSLGCAHSHFCNPHGLHHPNHYSTSYDMALIAMKALEIPLIRQIVSATYYDVPATNKQAARKIHQANKLLLQGKLYFEEAVGMKTGYTSDGGYCLLAAASNGQRNLIAAIYDSKERNIRYRDAIEMFTQAFEEKPITRTLFNAEDPPFKYALKKGKVLKAKIEDPIEITYYRSESPFITTQLEFTRVALPILKGDLVGELHIDLAGQRIKSAHLYAAHTLRKPFYRSMVFWLSLSAMISILVGLFIGWKRVQIAHQN